MVSNNGERYFEAELYRLKGELLFKEGTPANAEQCFKRSMEVAESQKARSWQLRTAMSLARLYGKQSKLREVYGSFTEGFDTEDLREAKELLQTPAKQA
jgi:predicted ATPase